MTQRAHFLAGVTIALAVAGGAVHGTDQRRAAGDAAKHGIQASLEVGGTAYESNAPGKCTHAPTASIYQVVSQMWSVQQSSDGGSLTLSVWRPKDGSREMVNLSVRSGSSSQQVSTVRGGGPVQGTAKITFEPSGAGGTFTIDARAKDGTPVRGTIRCEAFAAHVAEGG